MNKLIAFVGTMILGLMLLATPAKAQHAHSGGQHVGHSAPQHETHSNENRSRYTPGPSYAGHFDGHRFDHDYYRGHFGRDHHFRVGEQVFIEGRPAFFYSGFYFTYDLWPDYWSFDDDVYVDEVYENGVAVYYLANPRYVGPRGRFRLSVVF